MFRFFKSKKPKENPSPPWIKWLLIGLVFYAFVANLNKSHAPNSFHTTLEQAGQNLNPKNLLHLENYTSKIFPGQMASLHIKDMKTGTGAPALCGQEASIVYKTYGEKGDALPPHADKEQPLAFRIGEGKTLPAFEQGVLGMKPGGERSIVAPQAMAYGSPAFARDDVPKEGMIRFEVTLLSVSPPLPDFIENPYRVAMLEPGSGAPINCGDTANFNVTIFDIGGKQLYSSKDTHQPIAITPGKGQVFLGLEEGVIGMGKGGLRTLIVPPPFQKTMYGNPSAIDFIFPPHQTVLVDVESLQ